MLCAAVCVLCVMLGVGYWLDCAVRLLFGGCSLVRVILVLRVCWVVVTVCMFFVYYMLFVGGECCGDSCDVCCLLRIV